VKTVQQLTSFAQVNEYLRQFHDQAQTEYKLDNMLRLMDWLGNPQEKFKAVHIAGTSGKTSTAYYVSALLTATGRKTGLTVSPHVDEMNERVQINSQPLSEPVFCQAMTEFLEVIEAAPVKPSWFELMVAFAYWYFAREQVDYVVVEVGLGGLKDGTNVISRADKVCIITDIGFDHVNVLGHTLAEIAEQKAGIIHKGNPAFTYRQTPEIMAELAKRPSELHVVEERANPEKDVPDYQFRNGWLAYNVYCFLQERDRLPKLTDEALGQIRYLSIPGRMDAIKVGEKTVVFDGAHNTQKMEAFVASFSKLYPGVKPAVLLAMRTGKEYTAVAPILSKLASRIIVTTFETTQDLPVHSLPPEELASAFQDQLPVDIITDQKAAFKALLAAPEKVLVVTGSLYLLGQIRNNEHLA
jgi:dihydrofolate synthase/folylpolyglutamate synthase